MNAASNLIPEPQKDVKSMMPFVSDNSPVALREARARGRPLRASCADGITGIAGQELKAVLAGVDFNGHGGRLVGQPSLLP